MKAHLCLLLIFAFVLIFVNYSFYIDLLRPLRD